MIKSTHLDTVEKEEGTKENKDKSLDWLMGRKNGAERRGGGKVSERKRGNTWRRVLRPSEKKANRQRNIVLALGSLPGITALL